MVQLLWNCYNFNDQATFLQPGKLEMSINKINKYKFSY